MNTGNCRVVLAGAAPRPGDPATAFGHSATGRWRRRSRTAGWLGGAGRRGEGLDPGRGAEGVDEDGRGALPHPAGASLVRPELLDDLAVMVAGPASSRVRHDLLGHVSRGVVFVVAAQPAHGLIAFVAALGDAVEDRVVAHQELGAAGVAGVAVVDGAALARERADAVALGEIAVEVRPGRARVLRRDERQVLTHGRLVSEQFQKRELVRLGPRRGGALRHLPPGPYPARHFYIPAFCGGPGETPPPSPPVGEQLVERGARDADHRHVAGLEVG